MKVDSQSSVDAEKVLCHLTDDWQTRKSEGPRSKNETISFRYGVAATPHCWTLTEYRDGLALNRVYATSFADLSPSFKTIACIDPFEGMKRVIASLERITGKKISFTETGENEIEKTLAVARQVDSFFEVDYAIHDKVRERIFGDGEIEDES